ncbi:ABC transporter ATP-binding protein [Myxacorys almedinensis]|uniref:ATP-binding cassette domain-containing protein n=1 Tax=Myxacorys almedinensis A TaxID=2690445 RepID=A0A8J8CH51_9CYAN|nr:ABC transporter ATP-binding protein [Myxacorys almedinensis]NDJ16279.1 ATP-binding cassette domain-containing protein [Myxacorys almedinensis A]
MGESIISLKNVSKCFKRYAKPADRLKEVFVPRHSGAEEFWALRDINLEVEKGSTLGLVGQNGSGKSTLLQIVAGTLTPTSGDVQVKGRISALLELGSGFNPEFTGRQNVFFNGRVLGLSQDEIGRKFDGIAAFADIGAFIDQPVKTYSSGMFIRLAFAVAINIDPDILIVDEALAVGDIFFQAKCYKKLEELQDRGISILFVSHDTATIQSLCEEGVLLHHGQIVCRDVPSVISSKYFQLFRTEHEQLNQSDKPVEADVPKTKQNNPIALSRDQRITNGKATIREVYITDTLGQSKTTFEIGETLQGRIIVEFHDNCYDVSIGLALRDRYGRLLFGKHTWYDDPGLIPIVHKDEIIECMIRFELNIQANEYLGLIGIATHRSEIDYDSLDILQDAFVIQVIGTNQSWGITKVPGTIEIRHKNLVTPQSLMAEGVE